MFAELDPIQSSFLTGRAAIGSNLILEIDGVAQSAVTVGQAREFSIRLPSSIFDGTPHRIEARLSGQSEPVRNSPIDFQSNYQGYIHMEPFSGALLTGWAMDISRPGTPLDVEILLHGRSIAIVNAGTFREDLLTSAPFSGKYGFSYAIDEREELKQSCVIRARIAGTEFDLRGSPVLYLDTSRYVKTLHRVNSAFRFLNQKTVGGGGASGPDLNLTEKERRTFADLLLGSGNLAELLELSRWFQNAGSEHIAADTHRHRFYTYLSESFAGASAIRHPWAGDNRISVIFCVRQESDRSRVRQAFRLLMAQPCNATFAVICAQADDRADLENETQGREVHFLRADEDREFPAQLNEAVALHIDRDVAIVDCETFVPANWLERLRSVQEKTPAAGVVTPFGILGEICCYSAPGEDRAMMAELDAIFARQNAEHVADLPAVHGLCALIRRACLDEVGLFDDVTAGSRSASIVDFCLRAGTKGWRTILAADMLAGTRGGEERVDDCMAALDVRHPYYGDLLINFRMDDPTLRFRREVDLEILQRRRKPVYCFLTQRFGGGTERHVRDLCDALAHEGIDCLVIYSLDRNRVSCTAPALPGLSSLSYQFNDEFERLTADLAKLDIRHFHIHSNIAIPQELMGLPDRLGVRYDCTIHDYSWFCPRVNLVDGSGIYCGEPEPAVCDECVRQADAGLWSEFQATHRSVSELRLRSQAVLAGARKVFCPSRDTRFRMFRQFQLQNLEVRPNAEQTGTQVILQPAPPSEPIGVAIIGFISQKKGLDVLVACAQQALRANLPLRFVVVGFTEDDSKFDGLPNLVISGRYREGEAGAIIRRHQLRLGFFPTVWPETYSYTLSIALKCGLYPVGFDLGAIAERLRDMRYGHLIPLETSPEDINTTLIACGSMSYRPPPAASRTEMPNVLEYYYDHERKTYSNSAT